MRLTRATVAAARRFSSSAAAGGHELLHTSRIPTTHFQDSLPKLPIPKLEDSLKKLIYFAEPVASEAELSELKAAADAFAAGPGPALQAALVAKDKLKYRSFISEPWFDMYLRDNASLLLNYNPQLTFKDEEGAGRADQAGRAARMVYASMTFLRTLEAEVLEPDIFHTNPKRSKTGWWPEAMRMLPRRVAFYGAAACGAFPLDMSQYLNLFRSTRLPSAERDDLVVAEGSRHVVVQRGGRFFAVDVLDEEGGTLPLAQIHGAMQAVIQAADASPAALDESVGLLTSLPRDEWAKARAALALHSPNAASLAAIDSAIFAVSLEEDAPTEIPHVCRTFLHGDGVDRWLDKSFQLIVSANAKAAVNFEHAWGDGVAVLRFFNE